MLKNQTHYEGSALFLHSVLFPTGYQKYPSFYALDSFFVSRMNDKRRKKQPIFSIYCNFFYEYIQKLSLGKNLPNFSSLLFSSLLFSSLLFSSLLFMAVLSAFPNKALAQSPEPCSPDCPSDPWIQVINQQYTLTLCGNTCTVSVDYAFRIACPSRYQDVQIMQIRAGMPNCNGCSIQQIYTEVLRRIIFDNTMLFNPRPGIIGCDTTWRVSAGSCVAKWDLLGQTYGDNGDPNPAYWWKLVPCGGVVCCLQPLIVCRDLDSNDEEFITITNLPPDPVFPKVCDSAIVPPIAPSGTTCQPMCDWLKNIVTNFYTDHRQEKGDYPMRKSSAKSENGEESKIVIMPNPATDIVQLQLTSPETGKVSIRIFDKSGNQISKSVTDVQIGKNTIEISTHGIASGSYLFSVENGAISLFNGTLIITR